MKKCSVILVFLFSVSFYLKGQTIKCEQVTDTLLYLSFDIRSKALNSISMSGVTKKFSLNELSKDSVSSFVSSFYRNVFYVPDIFSNYKKGVLECIGDSLGNEYLKKHHLHSSEIINRLQKNSFSKKIILNSGEAVFIRVTKVVGKFWVVNKENPAITSNSNELDIQEIEEINKCYLPFEIIKYSKYCKIQ